MRIDKITPEQTAKFGEWAKKWIDIGLSTEPADFDKATAAALRAYELANLKRPMIILRMGSPYGATLGGALAWAMLKELPDMQSKVWSEVGSKVESKVESEVESKVRSEVESEVWDVNYNSYHGSFWSAWTAYVSFFRDVMKWDNPVLDRFKIDEDLASSCGWVWWHENVLAISDRPASIKRDDQGRLHNEFGPSMEYRDGWRLWHWHGVAVPENWITDKSSLTAKIALKCENLEQRRAACEILGWTAILKELKAKTIDTDDDPEIGELIEVQLPGSGKERFLRVRCGTGREFAIPVPPTMKTAIDANCWTYDISPDLLKQKEIRT